MEGHRILERESEESPEALEPSIWEEVPNTWLKFLSYFWTLLKTVTQKVVFQACGAAQL